MKKCISCQKELPITKFKYQSKKASQDGTGYSKKCKRCIIRISHKNPINKLKIKKNKAKWWLRCFKRDNQKCVDCGIDYTKANLLVHHIDESRKTGKLNNNLNNLVVLCKYCHARRHNLESRHEDIKEMRAMNMTLQAIADIKGVSRQRIYQILVNKSL